MESGLPVNHHLRRAWGPRRCRRRDARRRRESPQLGRGGGRDHRIRHRSAHPKCRDVDHRCKRLNVGGRGSGGDWGSHRNHVERHRDGRHRHRAPDHRSVADERRHRRRLYPRRAPDSNRRRKGPPAWSNFPGGGNVRAVLPEIILDDVRFQELVSEARTRIIRHSPDWTEHNVSDPGITLIELFAWITEILTYRINRIPERPPPRAARARRRTAGAAAAGQRRRAVHPRRTERRDDPGRDRGRGAASRGRRVGRLPDRRGTGRPDRSSGGVRQSSAAARRPPLTVAGGRRSRRVRDTTPFGNPPSRDDALLLGFERPIAKLVLRVSIECSPAEGRDVDPDNPPLTWEASGEDGDWHEAFVVSDETGSFLLGGGEITIEVPPEAAANTIAGKALHWLRCRLTCPTAERTRSTSRRRRSRP